MRLEQDLKKEYLESLLINDLLPFYTKICLAEAKGKKKEIDIKNINENYLKLCIEVRRTPLFDENGFLTTKFRDAIVSHPDEDSFGFIRLLDENKDRRLGNCAPSATLAMIILSDVYKKNYDLVWKDQPQINHVFLYEPIKKIRYDFTMDPFINKNTNLDSSMHIMNYKEILNYFYDV